MDAAKNIESMDSEDAEDGMMDLLKEDSSADNPGSSGAIEEGKSPPDSPKEEKISRELHHSSRSDGGHSR